MSFIRPTLFAAVAMLAALPAAAEATGTLRIATYNIQHFKSDATQQGDRVEKLKKLVEKLDADVIALQEIADRAATNLIFPPEKWDVVIDDDSADTQDLAVAIRKPLKAAGVKENLDADDNNFFFAGSQFEHEFPNRRDALAVEVVNPQTSQSITVVNLHLKSRLGGRNETDPRRVGAARLLVEKLKKDYEGKTFVVLGDMNDNPDDQSMNILETGDPNTTGGMEQEDGPFLANLAEPLIARDIVSHGISEKMIDKEDGLLRVTIPGSRERNDRYRGRDTNTGPILLDQILVPVRMKPAVKGGEVSIFREPFAVQGPGFSRPSDHLPVYADIQWSGIK